MTFEQWTSALACAGELTCAAFALRRATDNPLALSFSLLSLNLFAWNFAELAFSLSGQPAWHLLDVTASPLTPPLALTFAATFVGKRRALRHAIGVSYLGFTALSAIGPLAFFFPWARGLIDGTAWDNLFL